MSWGLPALGAAFSALLMLALATKWKLPKSRALVGITATVILTALPFLWIYPLFDTNRGLAVGVVAQMSVSLVLGLSLIMLRFWRDPERVPSETDEVVLSAADGEVVYIKIVDEDSMPLVTKRGRDYWLSELTGTSLLTDSVYVIGVGMSFLDVHVNRCPISGQVKLTRHIPGSFLSLGSDEAPFVNERLTTVIENASLTVAVVQVASRLVRRVQSYLQVGQTVNAGQRLGMIRFGSLVAVVLPQRQDVIIEVRPGDRVKAGVTVLARYSVNSERAER